MKERSGMPYDVVAFENDELALKLTVDAEGIFHRMLRKAWMNGSVPADLTELAYLCRINPRTMRKLWPQLAPLWTPISGNSTRIISKKLESERNFLERKRKSAQDSANARWKDKQTKELNNANALRTSNASPPLPSPSLPNGEANTVNDSPIPVSPPAEKRGGKRRCPDELPITDSHLEWAINNHISVDLVAETAAMIDWAHGKGEHRADWEATRRNWWRNAQKRLGGNGSVRHYESKADALERRQKENHAEVMRRISAATGPGDGPTD